MIRPSDYYIVRVEYRINIRIRRRLQGNYLVLFSYINGSIALSLLLSLPNNFKWLSCKYVNARLTTLPLKAFLINYELFINVYNFENWLFLLVVSLQSWLEHFIAQNHIRIIRIWRKNDNIFHIIDQITVSRAMLWIKHPIFANSKL